MKTPLMAGQATGKPDQTSGDVEERADSAANIHAIGPEELRIGRYETVAMPLFDLADVTATIEPGLDRSTLSVERQHVYMRRNRMRVAFQICNRSTGNNSMNLTAEIVNVIEFTWPDQTQERLIGVQGHFVLGSLLSCCDLYLTNKQLRSTALVLGQSFIQPNMSVDAGSAFTAGRPRHPLIGAMAG